MPLAKLGLATVAVALPSCGEVGDRLGDLYDDVQACREAIAALDGPVILCGHSYGGMIITEAGAPGRVLPEFKRRTGLEPATSSLGSLRSTN